MTLSRLSRVQAKGTSTTLSYSNNALQMRIAARREESSSIGHDEVSRRVGAGARDEEEEEASDLLGLRASALLVVVLSRQR